MLIIAFVGGSCQKDNSRETVAPVQFSSVPSYRTLTLSADQLVFLDWDGKSASRAKVVGKKITGDSAVEFDIHFPSNRPGNRSIDYLSTGTGGIGSLVGFNISSFETFALKFTLVSIDGVAGSDTNQELAVGALIGPTATGRFSDFTPVTLGGTSGRITAVSLTPVSAKKIYEIGFHAHMVEPERWSPSGSMVTIRVESVDKATVRPWP